MVRYELRWGTRKELEELNFAAGQSWHALSLANDVKQGFEHPAPFRFLPEIASLHLGCEDQRDYKLINEALMNHLPKVA